MKRILSIFFIILATSLSTPLFSGKLNDFKEKSEKEEKSKKSSDKKDNEGSNFFASLIAEIFAAIWYEVNVHAEYDEYPYASDNRNYIRFTKRDAVQTADGQDAEPRKRWYVLPEASYQYLDGETYSVNFNIHSRLGSLAGPYAAYRQYRSKPDGNLSYYQFGLDLALLQIEVFNLSYYLGFAGFAGILDRTGISTGLEFTILSFKPVCLNLRAGTLGLEKISYGEFGVRLGMLTGRSEIFAGYHHLSSETAKLDGFETGIRVWF